MEIRYKLDTFEGPLDLLLHLIDSQEIDIYDIPISQITDQYMAYIATWQEYELEVASEFLVMAAELLSIKSRMLLPKPPVIVNEDGEEEAYDPREELVQRLIEYRKIKAAADQLREMEVARSQIYTRAPLDLSSYIAHIEENPVQDFNLTDLLLAFQRVMRRSSARATVAKITRDEISVKDRMVQVTDMLESMGGQALFSRIVSEDADRTEIVVTFLALLELIRRKRVTCYQHKLFDDIVIQLREAGGDYELPADEISY